MKKAISIIVLTLAAITAAEATHAEDDNLGMDYWYGVYDYKDGEADKGFYMDDVYYQRDTDYGYREPHYRRAPLQQNTPYIGHWGYAK